MDYIYSYIYEFFKSYTTELTAGAAVLSLLSFILVLANYFRTSKILRKYKRLMRGSDNKNLEAMLYNHLDSVQSGLTRIKDLELSFSTLNGRLNRCIQRVGIVRYNAFDQMGGDQSYSIALLDDKGDGIVLTGLYGRSASTTFSKPIHNRQSKYALSNEEKEAIELAFK
jgi:hypothetical protein